MIQDKYASRFILSSSLSLMVISVLVKVLGYVEKRVLGHLFGTAETLDAYFTALKICVPAYFIARGILRPAVVPLLTSAKNRSVLEARNFGYSLALLLGLLLVAVTAAGIGLAPWLVEWSAPGLSATAKSLATHLTRWLFPSILLMTFVQLLATSFHVQKRFVPAAFGECLQKVVFIGSLILWVAPAGFSWIAGAYWLSFAFPLAYFAWLHSRRYALLGDFSLSSDGMVQTFALAWPIAVGGAFSNLGRLVQNNLASSLGPGSVSALTFAQTITDLPLFLVPLSISVVLLPYFSEFSDRREIERSTLYLARVSRLILILFIPMTAYALLFRASIVHLLFRGGQFDQDSLLLTTQALTGQALGLPFFALEMILATYLYARRRMMLAMVTGLVSTSLAMAALPLLRSQFHLAGVGAYLTVARAAKVAILVYCLPRLGVAVPWRRSLVFVAKVLVASAASIALWLLVARFMVPHLPHAARSPLAILVLGTGVLVASNAAGLVLLRFPECRQFSLILKNRSFRPAGEST